MPEELIVKIFLYLSDRELNIVTKVCKGFWIVVRSFDHILWKSLAIRDWRNSVNMMIEEIAWKGKYEDGNVDNDPHLLLILLKLNFVFQVGDMFIIVPFHKFTKLTIFSEKKLLVTVLVIIALELIIINFFFVFYQINFSQRLLLKFYIYKIMK